MSLSADFPAMRPTLNLNFARARQLDPRITFTRASTATYFDSSGVLQTAIAGQPRFDFSPTTGESLGLLIEEQRTNSIRNNTMQGAVAGTPGTLPTNWATQNIGGVARSEIVGIGTENGISYIDIRYAGTTSSTASGAILSEVTTAVSASSGQTWTNSFYLRLVGGSTSGITRIDNTIQERDSGGVLLVATNTGITVTSNPLNTQRFTTNRTLNNASTAFVSSGVRLTPESGVAVDITLRIGLPQLEQGSFDTSVIPTTTAAATRNADVASMTGTNFSSWYNATEGTVFADYIATTATKNCGALALSDGGNNNRMIIRASNTSTQTVFIGVDNTATQWSIVLVNAPLNTLTKSIFGYKVNDIAVVRGGGSVTTDQSAIIPTVNQLRIGADGDGTLLLNGTISRIAYYPVRLSDDQLQALTR